MAGDPIIIGSHLEFTVPVTLSGDGQTALVIWHAICFGPNVGAPTTQDAANGLDALISTDVRNLLSNTSRYRGVGCRLIDTPPTRRMFAGVTGAGLGTIVTPPCPTQTRALITWRTNFAGRGARGRSYLWPFADTAIDANGDVSVGFQGTMLTLANVLVPGPIILVSGPNQAGVTFAIRKRASGLMTVVTDFVIRTKFGTQKRSGALGRVNSPPF
jgi:hypothetical protein